MTEENKEILNEVRIRRYNSPRATPTFRTLEEMIKMSKNSKFICAIEEPYGIPNLEEDEVPRIREINYGHVVGAMNEADKNEWDCIFPGYRTALNLVVCDEIIGYVHSKDGNHKLICLCYDAPNFSEEDFEKQLKHYVQKRKNVYDETCHAKIIRDFKELLKYSEY